VEHIEKILDAAFLQKALDRFNDMFLSLKEAKEKNL
jgi:hypothetical protein